MHQCIKFILFWNDTVHVSDGLSVHRQGLKTVRTASGICQTDTAVCMLANSQTDTAVCMLANSQTDTAVCLLANSQTETAVCMLANSQMDTAVCLLANSQMDTAVCLLANSSSVCLTVAVCIVLNS